MSNIKIEISICSNCGKQIYLGPRSTPPKKYQKYDTGWAFVTWRHVDTQSHTCKKMVATPREEPCIPSS